MYRIARNFLALLLIIQSAHSSGFKINEQSLRSIALSSAYVAAAYGADSSYFNPANMGFLNNFAEDKHELEISLTAIAIPKFRFTTDTRTKNMGEGSINWGLTSQTKMGYLDPQTGKMNPLVPTMNNGNTPLGEIAQYFGVNLLNTAVTNPEAYPIIIHHNENQHYLDSEYCVLGNGDAYINENLIRCKGYEQQGAIVKGSADTTIFPVPKIFYKSKSFLNYGGGGFNVGASLTIPSGLAMNWNGEAGAFLKDVMIGMIEVSPALSYQFREMVGIGFSPRILYGIGNFNNTVYVPLDGDVLLKLTDLEYIPDELVPEVMQELVNQINTAKNTAGFAGLLLGGGAHWDNEMRVSTPTLMNPEAWFGLPSIDYLGSYSKVRDYNKKVDEANAIMKKNWNHYQNEWANGNLDWRYNDKTCAAQDTICLPTAFNPVPMQTYQTTLPDGKSATGFKFVNGINYCIQNGYSKSWWFGCQNMDYTELDRLKTLNSINGDLYVNCYTGTFYDYNGNLQTSNPGPCNYPNPTEKDADGAPRGYKKLWDAKTVAEKFGMGDMDIKTALKGSTKVEQRSNGQDIAFGYRVGLTYRPINTKNYSLTASVVFDSPVNFKFKGKLDADTYIGGSLGDVNMKADLVLETQLPAQLKIGIAQQIYNFTVEFVWERIWWKDGKKFDFAFKNEKFTALDADSVVAQLIKSGKIIEMMDLADYGAVAMGSGWKDTNAYRVGLTYRFDNNIILMGSFAYDESPVPQNQLGIPDSTAYIFGGGANVPITENLSLGASLAVYFKDGSKSIYQSQDGFGKLILANVSMGYSF